MYGMMCVGIGGGGGGGSSYVHVQKVYDYVVIPGDGFLPGGMTKNPPKAAGIGEWDLIGGYVGQGGRTIVDKDTLLASTKDGNAGAVRIIKPGFY